MSSTRHKWGERVDLGPRKSEKQCKRCGMVRASLHGADERGAPSHWKEFWQGEDLVARGATPPCDARLEVAA